MKPNEFTKAVHIIEDEYGGPDKVPDDAWEEFADFRKAYFRKEDRRIEMMVKYHRTMTYQDAMNKVYSHMSTSQMTLEEIAERLNANVNVTRYGKFPLTLEDVKTSLSHRALPYIRAKENDVSDRSALGGYIK